MNETTIVTVYVVIDETLKRLGHQSHVLAQVSDAEVLTVAVLAARYFGNHHERPLCVLRLSRHIRRGLSISRFNRRLHALSEVLEMLVEVLLDLAREGEAFIIDSLPLPVCRRVRAQRCRKVTGVAYYGYCAAKRERFYGYRLHLVCSSSGSPVAFQVLHDLHAVYSLTACLPCGALVAADKGYISAPLEARVLADFGVRFVVARRKNMLPNTPADDAFIRTYRHTIEIFNSQLESMGTQHLRARTLDGFLLKVHAALFALACFN